MAGGGARIVMMLLGHARRLSLQGHVLSWGHCALVPLAATDVALWPGRSTVDLPLFHPDWVFLSRGLY